jgi:hypothetical protein
MECLHCGKKLGVLRKLQKNGEFCSAAHRKAYAKKQNDDALDFLMTSKPRLRPPVPPVSGVESSTPQAVEAKPLLVPAQFVAEHVAPWFASALPQRDAQPVEQMRAAVLPAGAHPAGPRLLRSNRASAAILSHVAPVHGPTLALKDATPFDAGRPRVRVTVVHPVWIGAERPAAAKRTRAGFLTVWPIWINLASHPLRVGAIAKFAIHAAIARANLTPHRPAFRLAVAQRPSPQPSRGPGLAIERNGSAWQPCTADVRLQTMTTVLRASGPRPCGRISLAPPPASPAPRCEAVAIPSGPLAALERPLLQALHLVPRTLSLGPAPCAHFDLPHPAATLSATIIGTRPSLIFKTVIRLGPFTRVGPIRPSFDTPQLTTPIRGYVREPQSWDGRWLAALWGSAPRWSRRLAVGVSLVAALLFGAGRLKTTAPVRKAQTTMMARITRRAVVDVRDDFRSGLSRWTGAPGWAGSWSYDATGFARPGRLALLSGSLAMDDYRLEFLAQIDKKAIGWVYRASDTRNYYAMKLVASKPGPAVVYSIIRYAVIDGHQRLKIQLPLPITASSKTMFRVRQEIRDAQFTTYLDGRLVDTWSDATLTRGGVGFFAEPGEAAYVRWVEVAHNNDTLGRLCAYLAARSSDVARSPDAAKSPD